METLMILTYTALCIAIFKIFKIPMNKWTVPTAVLGGVVLVGSAIFIMNYNYPHSKVAFRGFVSVPINPNISGLIVEVPVQPNTHVEKGTVLFKINPDPFELAVAQKKSALNVAKAQIPQKEGAVKGAQQLAAQKKTEWERNKMLYESALKAEAAMAAAMIENKKLTTETAKFAFDEAQSKLESARIDLKVLKEEKVAQLEADVKRAEFDLESTVVKAPASGYVTQVRARPGLMAVPFPMRSALLFIPDGNRFVIGLFRQNAAQNLVSGYETEIIFPALPGKIFKGKVKKVLPALGEGELQAAGAMIKTSEMMQAKSGLIPVLVEIEDDVTDYVLPDGSLAEVAVYSGKAHHVAVIRKMLLRMKSWQNYIYLDH